MVHGVPLRCGPIGPRMSDIAQDVLEAVERPIQIRLRDHQRRRQADDRPWVSFDRTPLASRRSHASRARGESRINFRPDPQPAAADRLEGGAREGPQPVEHMATEHAAFLDQPLIGDDAQRFEPDRGRERIAPEIEPWEPGVNTSMTSPVATKAETGSKPPPSALPSVIPSGRTPSWSQANQAPVRPRPDWTSSAISSTRWASHRRRTPASQPAGGTMMPASPWIGSISTATVLGVIAAPSRRGRRTEPRQSRA